MDFLSHNDRPEPYGQTEQTVINQAHVSRYLDPVCLLVRQVWVQQTQLPASSNGLFSRTERFRVRGRAGIAWTQGRTSTMGHFRLGSYVPLHPLPLFFSSTSLPFFLISSSSLKNITEKPHFRRRSPLFFFLSPTSFHRTITTPYSYYYHYHHYRYCWRCCGSG